MNAVDEEYPRNKLNMVNNISISDYGLAENEIDNLYALFENLCIRHAFNYIKGIEKIIPPKMVSTKLLRTAIQKIKANS